MEVLLGEKKPGDEISSAISKLLFDIKSFCQAVEDGYVSSMNFNLMKRINAAVVQQKTISSKQQPTDQHLKCTCDEERHFYPNMGKNGQIRTVIDINPMCELHGG